MALVSFRIWELEDCDTKGGDGELPECKPCPSCYSSLKYPPFGKGRGISGFVPYIGTVSLVQVSSREAVQEER